MKLLTHNILTSKVLKNVTTGYPLKLTATKTEVKKSDYQPEFIDRMMRKVDYKALFDVAQSVSKSYMKFLVFSKSKFVFWKIGVGEGLPNVDNLNEEALKNEEILKRLHHVLLELEIIEGDLVCPETGRKFPIKNGIPNMLVNEDE